MEQKKIVKYPHRFFGATAVDKGFITREQLLKALWVQQTEDRERQPHRIIGLILYEMGLMKTQQIKEVYRSLIVPLYEL